jgi:anti-sigma B factor antagonist
MSATPSADIPQFKISSDRGPDGANVVHVSGEVDIAHEEELRSELQQAVSADSSGIVVDLTDCEFIDSSAIRALLVSREAQAEHGEPGLAVAASSDQILRILSVMGIDKVIPVSPTVEQAAAELQTSG